MTASLPSVSLNQRARRIRSRFGIRHVVTVVALTLAWCGLWQEVSAANVLGGGVLAVAVLALGVGTSGKGGVRLVPLGRLFWLVLVDLVTSTIDVAKEIATPGDDTDEAIIAVEIPAHSRQHLLLLIVAVTLTPGTAVVDADPDSGTLYLHLLHYDRAAAVSAHVSELAELADQALPTNDRQSRSQRSQS